MKFTRRAVRGGAAIAGILLTIVLATPAAADPTGDLSGGGRGSTAQLAATTGVITRMTPVPANGRVSCFGYYGTFKAGTDVMVVDWATSSDECFGVATDRTIWHTWTGSGGWTPMPGNAHADFIYPAIGEWDNGQREVAISIPSAPSWLWCNYYTRTYGWLGWNDCTP